MNRRRWSDYFQRQGKGRDKRDQRGNDCAIIHTLPVVLTMALTQGA